MMAVIAAVSSAVNYSAFRYTDVDTPSLLSVATAKGQPERVAWIRRASASDQP